MGAIKLKRQTTVELERFLAKKFNIQINNMAQSPTPVRLCDYVKERLKEQADNKGITLHKHLVQTLEKQAKKPIKTK